MEAPMLPTDDLQRYKRQLLIDGWDEKAQEKLKESHVFIAGSGGLGSPLLMYLAVAGVGNLTVCDFDRVDLTNLNRQTLHNDRRIGMPKAESARVALVALNPTISITALEEKITGQNAERLTGRADILVDCLDNVDARHHLNAVAVKRHIPMVHAGITGLQGQITFLHPPETPCLACFFPERETKGPIPVLGATPGILGAMQAMETIKYLTGIGENLRNRLLFFDGMDMNFATVKIARNPRCRACGS